MATTTATTKESKTQHETFRNRYNTISIQKVRTNKKYQASSEQANKK